MSIGHAYAIFCDDQNLPRIDATPEQHIKNLHLMMSRILKRIGDYENEIGSRCPACKGSGKVNAGDD